MKKPLPKNEVKRLKVLWQYDVLDTVPEEVFDDLTELAAKICEAPIALISLVDEKRQWFKSKVGLTVQETSRDISFCGHAIKQEGLFIVPDATKDQRFANNPLVTSDPKIRFYAGAPLITPDGYALGTLCVLDKVPRELRPDQQQAMRVLARHVMSQLELRRHARELADARQAHEEADGELKEARAGVARLTRELAKRNHAPKKTKKR
jgi:GAF domain-containing protein